MTIGADRLTTGAVVDGVTDPTGDEPGEPTFDDIAAAVDDAVARLDELDDSSRAIALELKAAIEAFHRPALVAIVQALRADPRGKELLFELVDDTDVRAVFGLHGIIRADPMTRGEQALASVRPYLRSHGGDVELVRIDDGVAHVRLVGSCDGCSMSAMTLRDGVEEALVAGVDEIDRIEVVDTGPTETMIPVEAVGRRPSGNTGWVRGPVASDVPVGGMVRVDLTLANGPENGSESFIVTNVDRRVAVFRNACAHQGMTLDGGMITDGVLVCPWHGFSFDASTGECISAPGAQLEQLPTRVDDGHVWILAGGR